MKLTPVQLAALDRVTTYWRARAITAGCIRSRDEDQAIVDALNSIVTDNAKNGD